MDARDVEESTCSWPQGGENAVGGIQSQLLGRVKLLQRTLVLGQRLKHRIVEVLQPSLTSACARMSNKRKEFA
jgi:hypothetical protein